VVAFNLILYLRIEVVCDPRNKIVINAYMLSGTIFHDCEGDRRDFVFAVALS
jgi:hypothetical protein